MTMFWLLVGFRMEQRIKRLIETTAGGIANDHATNMLVLRGIDDEATLALAAGSIGNRISFYLLHLVGALVTPIFLLLIYSHMSGSGPIYMRADPYEFTVIVIGLVIPAIGFALVLLSGLCKGAYGRELMLGSLLCQVNSHSSPDQPGVLWVITLPHAESDQGALRHALYEHPNAAPTIVSWIAKQVRPEE